MTPDEIQARVDRRGPLPWRDACDLVLADLWRRTCEHRTARGLPMPPEHLRPRLAEPNTHQSKGDERALPDPSTADFE